MWRVLFMERRKPDWRKAVARIEEVVVDLWVDVGVEVC